LEAVTGVQTCALPILTGREESIIIARLPMIEESACGR